MPIPGGPTIPNVPPGAFTGLFGIVGSGALQGLSVRPTGPVGPYRSVRVEGVVGPTGPVEDSGSGDSGRGGCARARAACGARGVASACIARVVARAPPTRLQTTRYYAEIYLKQGLITLQHVVVRAYNLVGMLCFV